MKALLFKDRKLGVAEERHRYDIPLNRDAGAGFLITLIGLMTVLICLAFSGFLLLGKTTRHWESGLQGTLTIEIPPENSQGKVLSAQETRDMAEDVREALLSVPGVRSAEIMNDQAMKALIEPWLGKDIALKDFPLPVLVTVGIDEADEDILALIKTRVDKISSRIQIDAHEMWMKNIMAITRFLKFIALFIVLLIGGITVVSIAGAMRMRMAMHQDDVELLHLMGANDHYITRQFQRHALILSLKGTLAGLLLAFLMIAIIQGFLHSDHNPGSAAYGFGFLDLFLIVTLSALICGIASYSARYTVLRALAKMP